MKMLRNQKAQAVLELAILGALIIATFAILISYSEKYNREQSYMQQTFRAALKKARAINNSVSLDTVDFRRMPNISNPMEIGQLQQFSSSSSVLWSDGKKLPGTDNPTEAKSYYQFNRGTTTDITGSGGGEGPQENTTTSSSSTYVSNLTSTTDYDKRENSGVINTQKILKAKDSVSASFSGEKSAGTVDVLTGDSKHGGTYIPYTPDASEEVGLIRKTENAKDIQ
jgi:hypothetical protein